MRVPKGWGAGGVVARRVGAQTQKKWGDEGWSPKIRSFFPLPQQSLFFLLSLGLLVELWPWPTQSARLGFTEVIFSKNAKVGAREGKKKRFFGRYGGRAVRGRAVQGRAVWRKSGPGGEAVRGHPRMNKRTETKTQPTPTHTLSTHKHPQAPTRKNEEKSKMKKLKKNMK